MIEPSASKLQLASVCGHPFTAGIDWPEDDESRQALIGRRVHLGCEATAKKKAPPAGLFEGLSVSERETVEGCIEQGRVYLESISGTVILGAEVRLSYNVITEEVTELDRWGLLRADGEWTAILDLVGLGASSIRISDYKTGRGYKGAAKNSYQLRLQAVAARRRWKISTVRAEYVHLAKDRFEVDGVTWNAWDLDGFAADFRQLRTRLTSGPTPPVLGRHCTELYCPIRGKCAATKGALDSLVQLAKPLSAPIRTDDDARHVYDHLEAADAALAAKKAELNEYVRTRPLDLGDRVFKWQTQSERSVKASTPEQRAAIYSVLGEYGHEAVRTEHKVTLGSIEAAARKKLESEGKKTGISALAKQVHAALEKVGGYAVTTYEKPGTYKRSK